MIWQRGPVSDSVEQQMLQDRARLDQEMTNVSLAGDETVSCFQAGANPAK